MLRTAEVKTTHNTNNLNKSNVLTFEACNANPTIKKYFGRAAAFIFSHFDYLQKYVNTNPEKALKIDGKNYFYITHKELVEKIDMYAISSIRSAIKKLEESGILKKSKRKNCAQDQTNAYYINYTVLKNLCPEIIEKSDAINNIIQLKKDNKKNVKTHTNEENSKVSEIDNSAIKNCNIYKYNNKNNINNTLTGDILKNDFDVAGRMLDIWNNTIENDTTQVSMTDVLKIYLLKAYTQEFKTMENWKNYCTKITTSKFLMGESSKFSATLEWALNFKNLSKIKSGKLYQFGQRDETPRVSNAFVEEISTPVQEEAVVDVVNDVEKDIVLIEEITDSPNDMLPNAVEEFTEQLIKKLTEIRQEILSRVGGAVYKSWFASSRLLATKIDTNTTIVSLLTLSSFEKNRIENQYFEMIKDLISSVQKADNTMNELHFLVKKTDLTIIKYDDSLIKIAA
jgi:ribosomal protein S25